MREMPHCDLILLFNGRQEGPLVVDLEREDAVLVRGSESRGEDSAVGGSRSRGQRQTVEWREHGKLQLKGVICRHGEWNPVIMVVLGDLDAIFLRTRQQRS